MRTTLEIGNWNAICDQCGRQAKASMMTKRWDGFIVHKDPSYGCWEVRHPQDFVRPAADRQHVEWSRPAVTDQFVTVNYVSTSVGTQDRRIPSGTFNPSTL